MVNPNEHPLRIIIRQFVEKKKQEGYVHASYFGIDWDAPYCSIRKDDHFISLWTVDRDGNAARHIDNAVRVHISESERGEPYLEQTPMSRIPGAVHCRWTRKWTNTATYTIP